MLLSFWYREGIFNIEFHLLLLGKRRKVSVFLVLTVFQVPLEIVLCQNSILWDYTP